MYNILFIIVIGKKLVVISIHQNTVLTLLQRKNKAFFFSKTLLVLMELNTKKNY